MNIKLITLATAVAMSAALAQEDEYEETTEAAEESYQQAEAQSEEEASEPEESSAPVAAAEEDDEEEAEAPAAAAAAPAQQPGGLNVLHGVAYNTVGNEAAASTVRGNMASPYKMSGSNLFYVEPSNEYGVLSLAKGGLTYLLAFDNNANLGMVTAGIATGAFGVTVDLSLAKKWIDEEIGKAEASASVTRANDLIRVNAGVLLGAMDLTANIYWNTYRTEIDTESDANEEDNDFWDIGGQVILSNAPSATNLAWSAGLSVERHSEDYERVTTALNGAKQTTERDGNGAYLFIQPQLNIGLPVLSTESSRVLVGLNTRLPIVFFDDIENANQKTTDSYSIMGLYTSPNIFAEMALTENWVIFGGASFEWEVFSYADDELEAGDVTTDISICSMTTNNTMATAGARFQYKNLSLEASIADNLSSAAWAGLIGQFSGTLTF